MARNTGIEHATGKYICFFDSDDYVALNTIEKCCERAEKENADIVTFGFCNVASDGRTGKCTIPHTDKQTYCGNEVQEIFLPDLIAPDTATGKDTDLWMSAWASFYSMELIRRANWRFVSEREIISEDVYSLLHLYRDVDCVSVLSEALYFYCENGASLTHTYRADRYARIKHFYDECMKAADRLGYGDTVKERLAHPYLSNTIAALKMIVASDMVAKKETYLDVVSDQHLQRVLANTDYRKSSFARRTLLDLIKHKKYELSYLLVKAKCM